MRMLDLSAAQPECQWHSYRCAGCLVRVFTMGEAYLEPMFMLGLEGCTSAQVYLEAEFQMESGSLGPGE